ncbi:MAG: ESPR domain-containing protein, partial [Oxalobacter sp.]|nr:ESPR domain-containing protein [Oxalobacter sp.]
MNKTFKVIFSKVLGKHVVVSELVNSQGKGSLRNICKAVAAVLFASGALLVSGLAFAQSSEEFEGDFYYITPSGTPDGGTFISIGNQYNGRSYSSRTDREYMANQGFSHDNRGWYKMVNGQKVYANTTNDSLNYLAHQATSELALTETGVQKVIDAAGGGEVEEGETKLVSGGTVAQAMDALGNGKANKDLDNITDSGKEVIREIAKTQDTNTKVTEGAVDYDAGTLTLTNTEADGTTSIVTVTGIKDDDTTYSAGTNVGISGDGNAINAADSKVDSVSVETGTSSTSGNT